MSRGVSCASGAVWRFYLYPQRDGKTSSDFGQMQQDWEDWLDNLKEVLTCKFKSLRQCDRWLDREGHAILENGHAYIGVSEYCGMVCLWCVPKGNANIGWGREHEQAGLHVSWCCQVEDEVGKLLAKQYPDEVMVSMGHASNGEQFFRPLNRPEGVVTTKEGVLF